LHTGEYWLLQLACQRPINAEKFFVPDLRSSVSIGG